jgi:hypothetical protein
MPGSAPPRLVHIAGSRTMDLCTLAGASSSPSPASAKSRSIPCFVDPAPGPCLAQGLAVPSAHFLLDPRRSSRSRGPPAPQGPACSNFSPAQLQIRPDLARGEHQVQRPHCAPLGQPVSARIVFFSLDGFNQLFQGCQFYRKTLILHAFNISQTMHHIQIIYICKMLQFLSSFIICNFYP